MTGLEFLQALLLEALERVETDSDDPPPSGVRSVDDRPSDEEHS